MTCVCYPSARRCGDRETEGAHCPARLTEMIISRLNRKVISKCKVERDRGRGHWPVASTHAHGQILPHLNMYTQTGLNKYSEVSETSRASKW